jgi:hypothetical protein
MASEPETGYSFPSISPTTHPFVAKYTITLVKGVEVTVQFGLTTAYGRSTAPVPSPPGGGAVSILIAGMKASTTYHVRARVIAAAFSPLPVTPIASPSSRAFPVIPSVPVVSSISRHPEHSLSSRAFPIVPSEARDLSPSLVPGSKRGETLYSVATPLSASRQY